MKINVEIDCTPEEARRFLGLPDLAPMQEAVMAKLQEQMLENIAATSPEALLKSWLPVAANAPEQMLKSMASFASLFGAPGGKPPG